MYFFWLILKYMLNFLSILFNTYDMVKLNLNALSYNDDEKIKKDQNNTNNIIKNDDDDLLIKNKKISLKWFKNLNEEKTDKIENQENTTSSKLNDIATNQNTLKISLKKDKNILNNESIDLENKNNSNIEIDKKEDLEELDVFEEKEIFTNFQDLYLTQKNNEKEIIASIKKEEKIIKKSIDLKLIINSFTNKYKNIFKNKNKAIKYILSWLLSTIFLWISVFFVFQPWFLKSNIQEVKKINLENNSIIGKTTSIVKENTGFLFDNNNNPNKIEEKVKKYLIKKYKNK